LSTAFKTLRLTTKDEEKPPLLRVEGVRTMRVVQVGHAPTWWVARLGGSATVGRVIIVSQLLALVVNRKPERLSKVNGKTHRVVWVVVEKVEVVMPRR
jgi:hypothetical protein